MDFGFTLKPDHRIGRSVDLARRAEANGFNHGWIFDSHVLWRDPYPLLTLMAESTDTLRLGTCVTNPATREPSVTACVSAADRAVLVKCSSGERLARGPDRRVPLHHPHIWVFLAFARD